jgi:hypothetical protein
LEGKRELKFYLFVSHNVWNRIIKISTPALGGLRLPDLQLKQRVHLLKSIELVVEGTKIIDVQQCKFYPLFRILRGIWDTLC